jgi:hypothetical protein
MIGFHPPRPDAVIRSYTSGRLRRLRQVLLEKHSLAGNLVVVLKTSNNPQARCMADALNFWNKAIRHRSASNRCNGCGASW